MKTILCYGDSNTFGTNPAGGRYPRDVRWTGRLQAALGPDYYVIEEGMGGRNTVFDDPLEPNRNGLAFLPVALQSHQPLDLVILSLGTNDCKAVFSASPRVIAAGLERLVETVERFPYREGNPVPQLLLVSPIAIGEEVEKSPYVSYDRTSVEKSRRLAPLYEEVAWRHRCLFLDAAELAGPSPLDQLHLSAEGHKVVAKAIERLVLSYFKV